ncbi:MAG: alkaline phosphatase family protein [Steroidobacteraceae bacterium]
MFAQQFGSRAWGSIPSALCTLSIFQFTLAGPLAAVAQAADSSRDSRTPIKHVIVIVGENRTFDHIFATYKPRGGEHIDNLLSKEIVTEDGSPGRHYSRAWQYSADVTDSGIYQLSPKIKTLYGDLPAPLNGGPTNVCTDNGICTLAEAQASENGLAADYYQFLLTGGSGLSGKVPDSRIDGVHATPPYSTLPPGPFQLTRNGSNASFTNDSYAASPVHRFYQMWQQLDCDASYASPENPSGCRSDLFPWTEVSVGAGTNGLAQPANFSTDYAPGKKTTGEGSTSMGFYNMLQGDAPYTKYLADHYAISDNYHQPAKGGTGLDSIMLEFGDAIWFADADGNPAMPPHHRLVWPGTKDAGVVDEIENPNPQPGTNNWWIEDGYGGGGYGTPVYGGGSYTQCADSSQPGVAPVLDYLKALPRPIDPNCEAGHYYLLNNYNPGYFGDGSDAYTDTFVYNTPFTIPPTRQHSIADVLLANHVSWKSYNDQWNAYLGDKYQLNYGTVGAASDQYCNICNGFQYQTQIMTDPAVRTAHIKDTVDLYADIKKGTLPSVSFVKPSGWVDGHPASSKWDLYEGFVKKIVDAVQADPELWKSTAIFITTDEGGGYYDSGYVQTLDFFGDGTRIPLIAVSPYTRAGHVSHEYTDHVSILKFIERNWGLPTVSHRSRDNLANPVTDDGDRYVPRNSPAIGDLFDLLDFGGAGDH